MLTLQQTVEADIINKRLGRIYGRHTDCDKQRFRVVFSNDQIITRYGTFNDYLEGTEIFIRTVTETRQVKKYPHLHERWIVERLIPNTYSDTEGEKGTNYIYECLYAFPEGLSLNWRAVDFLIAHIFKRVKGQDKLRLAKTEKELQYLEDGEREKRRQEIRDAIDSTPLQVMLHDKSATSLVNMKEFEEKKEREIKS